MYSENQLLKFAVACDFLRKYYNNPDYIVIDYDERGYMLIHGGFISYVHYETIEEMIKNILDEYDRVTKGEIE